MSKPFAAAGLAAALLLAATPVIAESTAIYKAPAGSQEESKSQHFGIDPDLGRAWVEIDTWHNAMEVSSTHRVAVPGLSYDKSKAQVVYQQDGQSVVCATVRERGIWIFKNEHVEPTGLCELTEKYVKKPADDGFSVDVVEHFEVHFKPAPAGSAEAGKPKG